MLVPSKSPIGRVRVREAGMDPIVRLRPTLPGDSMGRRAGHGAASSPWPTRRVATARLGKWSSLNETRTNTVRSERAQGDQRLPRLHDFPLGRSLGIHDGEATGRENVELDECFQTESRLHPLHPSRAQQTSLRLLLMTSEVSR